METTEELRESDTRQGDNSETDQYDSSSEHPTVESQGLDSQELDTERQASEPREQNTEQRTGTSVEQQSFDSDHTEALLTNTEDIYEPKAEIFEPPVHSSEGHFVHCEQGSPFERQRNQQQPPALEVEGTENTESFHTPPEELESVQSTTDIMEGETALQTQSSIPSLEELKISEPTEEQGQTTMPRVPELSGPGETTQSLEDLSSGGSEGVNGSEAGNGISDNDQSAPSPTGNPGGGTAAEMAPTAATAKDSSNKPLGGKSKRKEDKAIGRAVFRQVQNLDASVLLLKKLEF